MPEPSGVLIVLSIVVAAYLVVRITRQRVVRGRSSTSDTPRAVRPRADRGHHLDAPAAMQQWEVDMHEIARDLSARIDSKMGLLEGLIRTAEREANRLERAIAEAQAQPASGDRHPPPSDDAASDDAASDETTIHPIATQAAEAAKSALNAATSTEHLLPRQEQIYQLADQGLAAGEIARQVGSPIGEVQLILSLRSSA